MTTCEKAKAGRVRSHRLRILVAVVLGCLGSLTSVSPIDGASGYLKPDVSPRILERAESQFNDGVELYQRHNYRSALRKFLSAEKTCPELFLAGYHVALTHRRMGNEESAIEKLKALNGRFPENIIAHNDLGVILASKNKDESTTLASQEFEKAIKNGETLLKSKEKSVAQIRVDLAMAYANVGALQLGRSKLVEAEKSLRKTIEYNPRAFFGHFGLGNVLFGMGRLKEAKEAYREAQELEPGNPNVHVALAKCYLFSQEKNPRFALSELEKIKAEPPAPEVPELLGDAHALLGNTEEAITHYRRCLRLAGHSPQVLYKLGAIHYNRGDFEEAQKYLGQFVEEVTAESGALSVAHKLLGDVARKKEDYGKAAAHYQQAIKLREDYFTCYCELAECLFHLERYEEAKESVGLLLDKLPQKGSEEENAIREKASALLAKIPSEN